METTIMICFGYMFDYDQIFKEEGVEKNSTNKCDECDRYRELKNPTPRYCGKCGSYLYFKEIERKIMLKNFTNTFPHKVTYEKNKNISLYVDSQYNNVYIGYIFFITEDSDLIDMDVTSWLYEMNLVERDLGEIVKENNLSGTFGIYTMFEYF